MVNGKYYVLCHKCTNSTICSAVRGMNKLLTLSAYIPHLLQVGLFRHIHGVVDEEGAQKNCGNQEFGSEGFLSFSFQSPSALRVQEQQYKLITFEGGR